MKTILMDGQRLTKTSILFATAAVMLAFGTGAFASDTPQYNFGEIIADGYTIKSDDYRAYLERVDYLIEQDIPGRFVECNPGVGPFLRDHVTGIILQAKENQNSNLEVRRGFATIMEQLDKDLAEIDSPDSYQVNRTEFLKTRALADNFFHILLYSFSKADVKQQYQTMIDEKDPLFTNAVAVRLRKMTVYDEEVEKAQQLFDSGKTFDEVFKAFDKMSSERDESFWWTVGAIDNYQGDGSELVAGEWSGPHTDGYGSGKFFLVLEKKIIPLVAPDEGVYFKKGTPLQAAEERLVELRKAKRPTVVAALWDKYEVLVDGKRQTDPVLDPPPCPESVD